MRSHVCKHLVKHVEAGTQRRIVIGISHYKWSLHTNLYIYAYGYGDSCICMWKKREVLIQVDIHIQTD